MGSDYGIVYDPLDFGMAQNLKQSGWENIKLMLEPLRAIKRQP
jgi:hypothetical protein